MHLRCFCSGFPFLYSREFQALQSADHLSLWVKQALASESCLPGNMQETSPPGDHARPPSIPSELWDALRARFNPAQIRAISSASRGSPTGCTIIQGPPGTGKRATTRFLKLILIHLMVKK